MEWVLMEIRGRGLGSPSEQLSHPPPVPTRSLQSGGLSPNVLLIIVILAVIFFVSALLHLVVRFLLRPPCRDPEEGDNVTALQGQLQQLFHLHDAGVEQSFIDTLPVFHYKAIIGSFDCAVCLCEFEPEDKLRLLPKCSHAFHMECIDRWLLSNSTCPLCRASLLPDSPLVYLVESGSESSREIVSDLGRTNSVSRTGYHHGDIQFGSSRVECPHEIAATDECVAVKLGKFRNVDVGGSSKNVDDRRCFSMGSFEYVMDENSVLQVPVMKKQSSKNKKPSLPGHGAAMSECDCESSREFNGFEAITAGRNKRESFSISKTWLRGNKLSSRASSFHFPAQSSATAAYHVREAGMRTLSAMHIGRWENAGSELGENQSCNSLDSQANRPSFARKTLLWLVGRQNKVVHSSFSPHV